MSVRRVWLFVLQGAIAGTCSVLIVNLGDIPPGRPWKAFLFMALWQLLLLLFGAFTVFGKTETAEEA